MESLAQFRKHRSLAALRSALLGLDLRSDTPEVNHRILSLLYYTAGHPLNVHYDPSQVALELLHPSKPAALIILLMNHTFWRFYGVD